MTGFAKFESKWRSITNLRTVEKNISGFGYSKEYAKDNKLHRKKSPRSSDSKTGLVNFDEPLEVKEENGEIFYREKDNHVREDVPETFETQYGIFINHYNGEFESWLGKEGYDGLPKKEKEMHQFFGREDYYIEGNYIDMFDCGEYSYAISNKMHLGLGAFKIVRIGRNLEAATMYDNWLTDRWECLEYMGRFQNERGYVLIASGFVQLDREKLGERSFQDETILFQIGRDGECSISKVWEIKISSSNSMAVAGDFVYFGQNKMVTRLNIVSGEQTYLTNKNDEEFAALSPMWL